MSWYSASHWEFFMMWNRMFGPMGWAYWILIATNIVIPLTSLWSRKLRVNVAWLFFISIVVNTGTVSYTHLDVYKRQAGTPRLETTVNVLEP